MNKQPLLTQPQPAPFSRFQTQAHDRRPLWADNALLAQLRTSPSRQLFVGALLVIALFAFEIFNFDTTQYALENLLGDVRFLGVAWATILAIGFCGIDFAGLAYLFMPERFHHQARETWYLMGAWLLGATMNALMTWWAVSLTVIQTQAGNELLSHQQLLHIVPIFVAVLVWLTRILFISAFSVAGSHLHYLRQQTAVASQTSVHHRYSPALEHAPAASLPRMSDDLPGFLREYEPVRMVTRPAEGAERLPLPTTQPIRQRSHSTPGRSPDSLGSLRQRMPAAMQPRSRRRP